jgi:hypothetical protein
MTRTLAFGLLLAGIAGPAVADCATAGLRVRCVYVGPDSSSEDRSRIGARFVVVAPKGEERTTSRRHFIGVPPVVAGVAAHHILDKGDVLPDESLILMNPLRYGLPRPENGWTYFKVGEDIYRAEIQSRRVLNYINPHINRY